MKLFFKYGISALFLCCVCTAQVGSLVDFTAGTTRGNPVAGKYRLWANIAGGLECLTPTGGNCFGVATGTVTSITLNGTLNQVSVTGTCAITTTGACTFALPANVVINGDMTTGFGGPNAGYTIFNNGTAPSSYDANSFGIFAPATVATGFAWRAPAAIGTGIMRIDASGQTGAMSQAELSGDCATSGSNAVVCAGFTKTIANGTAALGVAAIASGACAAVVSPSASGALSTDTITWAPNASIKAVTGYAPSTSGGLSIAAYPTSDHVNFDVCNWTAGSVTPGAVTLNFRVVR